MPSYGVQDFLKWWEMGGDEAEKFIKRYILEGLDIIVKAESDLLAIMPKGPEVSNPEVKWGEEVQYPDAFEGQFDGTTTLTLSGYLFNRPIDAETCKNILRVGSIVEQPGTHAQLKVTDASGLSSAPFTVEVVAYGNTTPTADATAVDYEIIVEPWADFRDPDQARGVDRDFRKVGTMILAETFEISKTRKNTSTELVADEVQHQLEALLSKLRRHMSSAIYRARPYWDGTKYVYGLDTEDPTMCGINTWPFIVNDEVPLGNTLKNLAGAELTKDHIDNLIMSMHLEQHAKFKKGDWRILVHPLTKRIINTFDMSYRRKEYGDKKVGTLIDVFDSELGVSFPIMEDQYQRPDMLQLCDIKKFRYGYFRNDTPSRKELPTQGRYERWLISLQMYGVAVRSPRQNIGTIYGFTNTL